MLVHESRLTFLLIATIPSRFASFDTFNSFDFFNLDIFDFRRLLLKIQRLTAL
jgi:hypothetical protein